MEGHDKFDNWKRGLEKRKFNWINLALVGITANIILITQGAKDNFFILSLNLFGFIALFEAIGIWIVETKNVGIVKNHWLLELYFYKTTLIDVVLLKGAKSSSRSEAQS